MNRYPPPSPHTTTTNTAEAGATVGIQASEVHNANIYYVHPQASPQERYRVGLRYLNDGVPTKAEELISEAIAADYDNAEVRFHWVLAMLSKRSFRDLARRERERLTGFAVESTAYPECPYKPALDALKELLCHLNSPDGVPDSVEKQILALQPELQAKIDRHLNLVLSGATRDKLWQDTREQAKHDRYGHNRFGRMWAYFHPVPIDARTRRPEPPRCSEADRNRAAGSTVLFTFSTGYLGWLSLSSVNVVAILAFLMAVVAGCFGIRSAFEWRYHMGRIRTEEFKHFARPAHDHARGKGFANKVSRSFEHYFAKYRPSGADSEVWLARTAGIRHFLREEVSELYREQRTSVGRVNWLIGFLAQDVRRRWRDGTLHDYRMRYQVTSSAKIQCVLWLAATAAASVLVFNTAAQTGGFYAWLAIVMTVVTGPYAALRWEHLISEKRRYSDECEEAELRQGERHDAYLRWKAKLDSTRPDEGEMETWLHCDKTALIDEALRHYRLSWRDVISSAIFQAPGEKRKRRRVNGGPWRYSRYSLRLFLITEDGVREVSSELDFLNSSLNGQERNNYRFDALSSVHVEQSADTILNLTLTNGPTRSISITDKTPQSSDSVDTLNDAKEITLDASGFKHALRILEGIAAEGKEWMERDKSSYLSAD